jgi:hypothetical protein
MDKVNYELILLLLVGHSRKTDTPNTQSPLEPSTQR